MDKIANLFSSAAFDSSIDAITSSNDSKVRATKRESALAIIRRYRNYLVKDGRMKLIKANPFVHPFTGLNLLNFALLDMEKNLLISL